MFDSGADINQYLLPRPGKQQTSIMSLLLSISGDKSMIGQIFNAKCRVPPFLCAALYCCC